MNNINKINPSSNNATSTKSTVTTLNELIKLENWKIISESLHNKIIDPKKLTLDNLQHLIQSRAPKYILSAIFQLCEPKQLTDQDIHGDNLLITACKNGNRDAVGILLDYTNLEMTTPGLNNTAFTIVVSMACKDFGKYSEILELLIKRGANIKHICSGDNALTLALAD